MAHINELKITLAFLGESKMDPLLQFLLVLSIIILAAKGLGYVSTRLGQPAVLGEILAGVILGPTALNMLHWPVFSDPHLGETVSHLSHLGVLFLLFLVGMEVDFGSMRRTGKPAVLAGVIGAATPVILGLGVARFFGFEPRPSLFIGLMLAATSVSISAQVMMELGVLRSRVGTGLLGAVVVDDILVILFLSLFTAFEGEVGGSLTSVLLESGKMVAFLLAATWFGIFVIPRLASWVDRLPISQGVMALVIMSVLLYAWAAEAIAGMAAIIGAFLAGLFFARTAFKHQIENGVNTLAYAWLVPIFFVSIGLEADVRVLEDFEHLPFALMILAAAVLSKIIGGGLGALLGGFSRGDALRLGVGMVARGEVLLIVAQVGLDNGVIGNEVFASMVLLVLATTLVTPIMLKLLYPKSARQPELV